MFPLGTVLFPHMLLPLHVFEPRYRALMHDVLAGDREFGVALISRGHEVGGGDQRTTVGTIARVLQAEELEDGRWVTVAVGTRRFRVERWLADDPYPRAAVRELEDEIGAEDDEDGADDESDDPALLDELLGVVEPRARRLLGMQAELGEEGVPMTVEFDPDPEVACWQLAVVSPLNPLDAQQVLETISCEDRLRVLDDLLAGLEETYTFRLATET
jgi:uncharacterized protein